MTEPTIHIVDRRHYDVIWRKTVEEYGDLQERHLLKAVNLMRDYPQYTISSRGTTNSNRRSGSGCASTSCA